MILDAYLYTQNATLLKTYLPIVTLTVDFFRQHYNNRTADGKYVIWPTQALETYWCAGWDTSTTPSRPPANCCVDDMPTVAALYALTERLLQLPMEFSTPQQREEWEKFRSQLPKIPLTADGKSLAAAGNISEGVHNSETPELYSVHPFRIFTAAKAHALNVDISAAMTCLHAANGTCHNAQGNSGWNQGVLNAALLGDAEMAYRFVAERAASKPAVGYRFTGFAAHYQDSQPSADHLANMNSAVNWMLLQPADDSFVNATIVLLPAWPCHLSVSFKLFAPGDTVVQLEYKGASGNATPTFGKVVSLLVTPASRKDSVVFADCVSSSKRSM